MCWMISFPHKKKRRVATATQMSGMIETASFVLTEAVPGEALERWLPLHGHCLGRETTPRLTVKVLRRKIISPSVTCALPLITGRPRVPVSLRSGATCSRARLLSTNNG